jgi:hypothetical protein
MERLVDQWAADWRARIAQSFPRANWVFQLQPSGRHTLRIVVCASCDTPFGNCGRLSGRTENRPLYVLPSDSLALIVPEIESAPFQLKLTKLAPEAVEPRPVPIVVQIAAGAARKGSARFTMGCVMSLLLLASGERNCRRCQERAWWANISPRFGGARRAFQP